MTPMAPGSAGAKLKHCVLITTIPGPQQRRIRTQRTTKSARCPPDILLSLSHFLNSSNNRAQSRHLPHDPEDLRTSKFDQPEFISRDSRHPFISDRQGTIEKRQEERKRWRRVFSRSLQDPEIAQTHLPTTPPPLDKAIPETHPARRNPPRHRFA